MKLKRIKNDERQYVILEEGYPHTLRLTKDEAELKQKHLTMMQPYLNYTVFYDAYYEFIEYYSETEKEQINRLIP